MPEQSPFAYSLCQSESGWRWSIYDGDGEVVAGGAHASRDAAEAEVALRLRAAMGANTALA